MFRITKNLFLLLTLSVLIFTTSCSDDDDNIQTTNKIDLNNIFNSKWNIINDKYRDIYQYIEFTTTGKYILIDNFPKPMIHIKFYDFGDYTVIDEANNIIELKNENGNPMIKNTKIEITSSQNDTIEFTLTGHYTDEEYKLKAVRSKEMASTTKTDLLCKTWAIVKFETTHPVRENRFYIGGLFIFSKAGTYLLDYPEEDYPRLSYLSLNHEWRWKEGSNETEIEDITRGYYSYPKEYIYTLKIDKLSQDSLIITEVDEEITNKYTLMPYTSEKK